MDNKLTLRKAQYLRSTVCLAEREPRRVLHYAILMQRSVANKAAAHVSSSKITQGTTIAKHTFGSRALYLQEYVSRSTDLHASVHRPRTVRGAGLHAQGLGG